MTDLASEGRLKLLSVVIPARDEEGCIASTLKHLHIELRLRDVRHEIVVVDDGSTDRTWEILQRTIKPITLRNRRTGTAKLKIKEMGSRYLFICLEKYFSAGDYRLRKCQRQSRRENDEGFHRTCSTN